MLNTCLGMRLVRICSSVQSYADCVLTLRNGWQKKSVSTRTFGQKRNVKNVLIEFFENELMCSPC